MIFPCKFLFLCSDLTISKLSNLFYPLFLYKGCNRVNTRIARSRSFLGDHVLLRNNLEAIEAFIEVTRRMLFVGDDVISSGSEVKLSLMDGVITIPVWTGGTL